MTVLLIGGAYQGKSALARALYPDLEKVANLHLLVKETLRAGGDPASLLAGLRGKCVTCDELGCGVVPLDGADDKWREQTGRLCCALAAEADAVARVVAGVPLFIKGDAPCM
ncbi:MAG: bifunctional adenosylcobinamide kinase/adenosylcobinamide-phosphate guanylyltransferase [Eubacteriales bacterium]|nr:bifunctional adenosylcobinamide kinase/adenosylcobinamide-phosphate guanylyltransferase [Eubacteriales bacterium]